MWSSITASGIAASRREALLGARLYKDPAEPRSFEAFIVHMHIAWLYLLHAGLARNGVDTRYRRRDHPRLLDRVDGEVRRWPLADCVAHRWTNAEDPIRRNLEFSIRLRNKIQHRYTATTDQAVATALGGHAQALLLNYEEELTGQFGDDQSLATQLRFPVFIGSFTSHGETALRRLQATLPAALRTLIADYYSGLDAEVASDPRFEFRLRVVNELAPRDPDALALQFTRLDDLTAEDRTAVEELGRSGRVIVREHSRGIVGHGLRRPGDVVTEVAAAIPFRFTMGDMIRSWQRTKVRPPSGSPHPERTDEKYCIYDERHRDYGYTAAFVRKLIRECETASGFRSLLDVAPQDKAAGA